VAFIASDFTDNQIEATNFKDIAIELYEVQRYEDHLLVVPIKKSKAAVSVKPITQKNEEYKRIAEEIEIYTEERLFAGKSDEVVALYERYRTAILALTDDIEILPQKWYISFRKERRNICSIEMQKPGLKISINLKIGELDDPKGIMRDVSNIGHFGNGDYEVKVTDDKNLEYIMSLVRQAIGQ
jgi:predicted transport protein